MELSAQEPNGGERPSRPEEPPEQHCIPRKALDEYLERRRADPSFPLEVSLADNLMEVLRKANEFVPSSAGSILLDHPRRKHLHRNRNTLTFIAVFGEKAAVLVGRQIPAHLGIAGHVYLTGHSYFASEAHRDPHFYPEVDALTHYTSQSLVAIPIRIEHEVCGVLELINRRGASQYSDHDRELLEIFAGYISISIQNVLDGRQAHEVAKRDNLTGLFNDRYLHVALSQSLAACRAAGRDLALLFLDLDFFKRVNDTHGHLAGSQVLREVGHLLAREVTHPEAIVARYGGDEFVLALPGMDVSEAVTLAERLREAVLQEHYCTRPGEIQPDPLDLTGITCSVGVATVRRHLTEELPIERSKSTLLRLADTAMYVAKETGRNRTALAGEPVPRRRSSMDHR